MGIITYGCVTGPSGEAIVSYISGTHTLQVVGNMDLQGSSWFPDITSLIKLVGTNQTLTGSGLGSRFGCLEIASLGTVTFANTGSIDIGGNFTHTSGTVITTGSTVKFVGVTETITPGSIAFNNVTFLQPAGYSTHVINGTLNVLGTLVLSNSSGWESTLDSGTINASGNLNILGTSIRGGGTTLIRMVGTGTVTGSGSGSRIGPFEIATAGTITFANTGSIDLDSSFTYTSGTVVTTGSLVRFAGAKQSINPGSMVFNNVSFSQNSGDPNNLTGTMHVGGDLTFNGIGYWPTLDGGTIEVSKNISVSGVWSGGSTNIVLKGTTAQTLTQTGTPNLPGSNLTVSSAASTLTLGSAVTFTAVGVTVTAGAVNMAGKAFTIPTLSLNGKTLTKGGGVLKVGGTTVGTGALYGGTINGP